MDIAGGKNHSILLNSSGEVYVTGINKFGELGQETSIKKTPAFTKIANINKIVRIDANDSGGIALNVDGKVYTWGQNVYGSLGTGNKTSTHIPVEIPNVSNIVDVSGGKYHSIVQDKEGNAYTVGTNTYGNLGNGTKNESLTFTRNTRLWKCNGNFSRNRLYSLLKTRWKRMGIWRL
ncbi:MAG: hypothetical protein HFJ50_06825 [Clostridia bacterium]|nr:hypothetical protein [Clostridia bacterium]